MNRIIVILFSIFVSFLALSCVSSEGLKTKKPTNSNTGKSNTDADYEDNSVADQNNDDADYKDKSVAGLAILINLVGSPNIGVDGTHPDLGANGIGSAEAAGVNANGLRANCAGLGTEDDGDGSAVAGRLGYSSAASTAPSSGAGIGGANGIGTGPVSSANADGSVLGDSGAAGPQIRGPSRNRAAVPVVGEKGKINLNDFTTIDQLLSSEVLAYLQTIITGNINNRESLMPADGFYNSGNATINRKIYGYTPNCSNTNGILSCLKADANTSNEVGKDYGHYFQITQGSSSNMYKYTYEGYRGTLTDFYVSGKLKATVSSNTVELKGQLRVHSTFKDVINSDENIIFVRFGNGDINDNYDQYLVVLDENNVAQRGKLTIRFYKDVTSGTDLTKTYDLGNNGSSLSEADKEQINNLNLFKVK